MVARRGCEIGSLRVVPSGRYTMSGGWVKRNESGTRAIRKRD